MESARIQKKLVKSGEFGNFVYAAEFAKRQNGKRGFLKWKNIASTNLPIHVLYGIAELAKVDGKFK